MQPDRYRGTANECNSGEILAVVSIKPYSILSFQSRPAVRVNVQSEIVTVVSLVLL